MISVKIPIPKNLEDEVGVRSVNASGRSVALVLEKDRVGTVYAILAGDFGVFFDGDIDVGVSLAKKAEGEFIIELASTERPPRHSVQGGNLGHTVADNFDVLDRGTGKQGREIPVSEFDLQSGSERTDGHREIDVEGVLFGRSHLEEQKLTAVCTVQGEDAILIGGEGACDNFIGCEEDVRDIVRNIREGEFHHAHGGGELVLAVLLFLADEGKIGHRIVAG